MVAFELQFMHALCTQSPLFRNIKGETSWPHRWVEGNSPESQVFPHNPRLFFKHWFQHIDELGTFLFHHLFSWIKTSGWKALKDHTCLMKIFGGLRKSKNLPKKTPNSPMYLSTEPPCQCQVYKNTWYKKAPFSVFLLHRLTTCTTPQNTPWVLSAILVSAIFYRTLPAMKCYEIATRPKMSWVERTNLYSKNGPPPKMVRSMLRCIFNLLKRNASFDTGNSLYFNKDRLRIGPYLRCCLNGFSCQCYIGRIHRIHQSMQAKNKKTSEVVGGVDGHPSRSWSSSSIHWIWRSTMMNDVPVARRVFRPKLGCKWCKWCKSRCSQPYQPPSTPCDPNFGRRI